MNHASAPPSAIPAPVTMSRMIPRPESTDCTSSTGRASSTATPVPAGAVMPRSATPRTSASQKYAPSVPLATALSRSVTGSTG